MSRAAVPEDGGGARPGPVLVVDYGAQYAQLIARRAREARVYSEIVPHTTSVAEIVARRPSAVVLSGGPESVYAEGAPTADPALFFTGVPVLGICYGLQAMAVALGGVVGHTQKGEFGRTEAHIEPTSELLRGLAARQTVWMSHGDAVVEAPDGFRRTAWTEGSQIAAFEDPERRLYGVQWHPEVVHTEQGQRVIENFLHRCAGIAPTWTTGSIIDESVRQIAAAVGEHPVIAGLSGGVDSAVAAALVQRAVGDQLTCVFVDHGLLREGEREQVEEDYVKATGVRLHTVDARRQFLDALAALPDPTDPEAKRKAIGREFIRAFEGAAEEISAPSRLVRLARCASSSRAPFTPTSSSPEAGKGRRTSRATTTSAAYPRTSASSWSSPCGRLFKDEVRAVGEELGLPKEIVWRQPFPVPGWRYGSSARSRRTAYEFSATLTRLHARSSQRPGWTVRSGSALSCCSQTSVR